MCHVRKPHTMSLSSSGVIPARYSPQSMSCSCCCVNGGDDGEGAKRGPSGGCTGVGNCPRSGCAPTVVAIVAAKAKRMTTTMTWKLATSIFSPRSFSRREREMTMMYMRALDYNFTEEEEGGMGARQSRRNRSREFLSDRASHALSQTRARGTASRVAASFVRASLRAPQFWPSARAR